MNIRAVLPSPGGSGVFLEAEGKVMALFIDAMVTRALQMALSMEQAPRPLTHDLLGSVMEGLGVKLLRTVIHDCRNNTYFARMYLQQENELGQSYLEVDCRPSDALVMAVQFGAPVMVTRSLWNQVEDMKWALDQFEQNPPQE